jgi:hypothetical protein
VEVSNPAASTTASALFAFPQAWLTQREKAFFLFTSESGPDFLAPVPEDLPDNAKRPPFPAGV